MSGPGASSGDMPEQPFPGRPSPEPDEPLLDMLLTGQPLPPGAPEQLHEVAGMLASLADPAGPGELAGEAAARSAFARAAAPVTVSPLARPSTRRRPAWLSTRVKARLAAALATVAVGLGGAAAAYSGVLPGPIQEFAHRLIGAPAAGHVPGTARRSGPAPAGPRASNPNPKPATAPKPKSHANPKGHANPKCHRKTKGHGTADAGKAKSPPGRAAPAAPATEPAAARS
jgi:hypothetical protein